MKKIVFIILFVVLIGGIIGTSADKRYIKKVQIYEKIYNENTEPLEYHLPTTQEITQKGYSLGNCDSKWCSSSYCLLDQFNQWHDGRILNTSSFECDLKYSEKTLETFNRDEKACFQTLGITIRQNNVLRKLESAKKKALESKFKNTIIFITCYLLIIGIILFTLWLFKKFNNEIKGYFIKIKQFFITMNYQKYLILLASLATLALICIAIKLCL